MLILYLCWARPSFAEGKQHIVKGIGELTCFDYRTETTFRDGINTDLREWALGFASAMNIERQKNNLRPKSLKFLTGDLVVQEVEHYCAHKTEENGLVAAIKIIYDSLPLAE